MIRMSRIRCRRVDVSKTLAQRVAALPDWLVTAYLAHVRTLPPSTARFQCGHLVLEYEMC